MPRTGHIPFLEFGAAEALTQVGPLARRVEDLELVLQVIAGPDGVDPYVVPVRLREPAQVDLRELRIAYYADNGLEPDVTRETRTAVRDCATAFSELVACVLEERPPGVDAAPKLWRQIVASDGGATVRELLQKVGTERMHPFLQWTQDGEDLPTSDYEQVLTRWSLLRSEGLTFLQRFDAIICPVNATPATLHEEPTPFRYAYPYNLLGWPVVVIRCATSPEGLPIGVQIVARPWREDVALAVAAHLETVFGGWSAPPI